MEGSTATIIQHKGDSSAARPSSPGLRYVRATTAVCCAALVAGAVLTNSLEKRGRIPSIEAFVHGQTAILGYTALVLAGLTLPLGFFYGRGLAARMRIAPQARAAHMTISISAITTIALHVVALGVGTPFTGKLVARLAIPYYWPEHAVLAPTGAGVLGFWLIALFGLSYSVRRRIGGERRWRIAHHLVLAGVALAVLHAAYWSGLIPGWA